MYENGSPPLSRVGYNSDITMLNTAAIIPAFWYKGALRVTEKMLERRKTKTVTIGPLRLGSGYPIAVQSMTKVHTTDVQACVHQVKQLASAGCALVRIAVPTQADTKAFAKIAEKSPIRSWRILISPQRAIEARRPGGRIRLSAYKDPWTFGGSSTVLNSTLRRFASALTRPVSVI